MGAGHVTELGCAVLGPASGPAQVWGPTVLPQREEGGPGLPAAEALVTGMFPPRLIGVGIVTTVTSVTHPSRPTSIRDWDCVTASRVAGTRPYDAWKVDDSW